MHTIRTIIIIEARVNPLACPRKREMPDSGYRAGLLNQRLGVKMLSCQPRGHRLESSVFQIYVSKYG